MAEAEYEVEKRLLAELEAKRVQGEEEEEEEEKEKKGEPAAPKGQGKIVVGEDGTLREIDEENPPGPDDPSPPPK
jgi:hypothetical protein